MRFWSKSFVGFKLRGGLNYAQFLGLPEVGQLPGAGHKAEPLSDEITINLQDAIIHTSLPSRLYGNVTAKTCAFSNQRKQG